MKFLSYAGTHPASALLLASVFSCTISTGAAQTYQDLLKPNPNNWLQYSGTYDAQRHSLLNQINTSNVPTLQASWVYHMTGAVDLEAVPIVVDGIMYVSQWNRVEALDARVGRLIWQYMRPPQPRGWQRGVAAYGGKVYVGAVDSSLIALDAKPGNLLWETKAEGEGRRMQGAAPLIAKGKVIMGGSGRGGGWIQAFDADTGKHAWTWNVIPKPGEKGIESWEGDSWRLGGGPVWNIGSWDPELNTLYWGTGQPGVDFVGDIRKGDNLYTDCIVALDIDTGKMKWYFQNTPHDTHDWDSTEIIVLADMTFKGKPRKVALQANRNGFYYILDRTNGEFLQATPFVSGVDWGTVDPKTGKGLPDPAHEPTVKGTITCPSTAGATNWPSPAYNPATGLFYVTATEGCGVNTLASSAPDSETSYLESPRDKESWQLYTRAIDAKTGAIKWDYKQVRSNHYGPGLLTTEGGIVFSPEQFGQVSVLDARTGRSLWHYNTGDLITASPLTYSVDGHQYLAIASGTNILTFGLPERATAAEKKP